jgi:predicted MFS family arabinose efflux permease
MVVFPLLPDLQERADISTAQLGWIAASGFVAALVAQTLIAPHADRGRERWVINGAIVMMALSTVVYAVGDSIHWFIAGRIGAGLAYGAFTPAAIGLIVRRWPDAPGRHIGRLQAIELGGMALGPLLAVAGKVWLGVLPTLWLAGALTLLAGVPAFASREVRSTAGLGRVGQAGQAEGAAHHSLASGFGLLRHRSVIAAALVMTAFFVPIGAYDALFPRFLVDLGASDWLVGAALMAFAIPSMFLATWAGRTVDRLGPFRAASLGGAANVAVILTYGFVRVPMVIVVIGLFESGGQTLVGAAGAAAMGWAVPGRRAATAQGLGEATATTAGAAVAFLAAPLYAAGGPALLFVTTAALTAGPLALGVRLARTARPVEDPVPVATLTDDPLLVESR